MKSLQRRSNLSDAELSLFAGTLAMFMEKDSAYFQARGVSEADRLALKAVADSFKYFHPDEFYQGDIMKEADEKLEVRSRATKVIQKVSGYFEQAFGLGSAEYDRLQIRNLMNLRDRDFLFAGRNVASVASDELSSLSAIGLTQSEIDSLASDMDSFEAKLHALAEAKKLRREKRLERIAKSNELYDLVVKYCRIGKLIWEGRNSAKYKQYLIYPGKKKKPKKDEENS